MWKTDPEPSSKASLAALGRTGNRARSPLALAVDVATVSQSQDQHQKPVIVHLIEHPVGTDTEAQESRKALERLDSSWSWLLRQTRHGVDQTALHNTLESLQLAAGGRPQTDLVSLSWQ